MFSYLYRKTSCMIVPTMALEEIAMQYQGDMDNILAKRYSLQPKFSSLVKKSRKFPVVAQYEYISHTNHNRYFFNYSAQKRGEWFSTGWKSDRREHFSRITALF